MTTTTPPRIERVNTILFEVTTKCNLDCVYCYNAWKNDAVDYPDATVMSTRKTKKMLKKVIKESEVKDMAFTGGEPLLRDDLAELAACVALRRVRISVLTNGKLLDKLWVKDLSRLGVSMFQLTILGADAETHDRHCGEGSFKAIIDSAELLRSMDKRFSITHIVTQWNRHQIEEVMRLQRSLGVTSYLLNRFNAGGRGIKHIDELMLYPKELEEVLRQVDRLAGELHITPFCAVPVPPCVMDWDSFERLQFTGCWAGTDKSYFTLDPVGNIRTCNHSPLVLGNVHEEHFIDIVNKPAVHHFVQTVPEMCVGCKDLDKCHGGCKAAQQQMCGDISVPDPFLLGPGC